MYICKLGFFIKGLVLVLIWSLFIFTGCAEDEKKINNIGAGPTIEEMGNHNKDKDKDRVEVIEDAIRMSETIMASLNSIEDVETAIVFINHEAVLVALKLNYGVELSKDLKENIEAKIYEIYPEAKTVAMSNDEYVYESISKLLKSYKENDQLGEFIKDLKEIIQDLK